MILKLLPTVLVLPHDHPSKYCPDQIKLLNMRAQITGGFDMAGLLAQLPPLKYKLSIVNIVLAAVQSFHSVGMQIFITVTSLEPDKNLKETNNFTSPSISSVRSNLTRIEHFRTLKHRYNCKAGRIKVP